MARANFVSSPYQSSGQSPSGDAPTSPPSSPAASFSSDKENKQSQSRSSASAKGKDRATSRPQSSSSSRLAVPMEERDQSSKRRKLSKVATTTTVHEDVEDRPSPTQFYDPDQPVQERRQAAKALRQLTKELHENSRDFIKDGNSGLHRTILEANKIMTNKVKQTTDAIIDSNLLVNAANLSYKKATALRLGDDSASIDVDEFVSKCRTFMNKDSNVDSIGFSVSQFADGRRSTNRRESDITDAVPWHVFGTLACLPANRRPSAPSFLLGPLSIQPRARKTVERRTNQRSKAALVRPEEIRTEDIQKQKTTNNITVKCAEIKDRLRQAQADSEEAVGKEVERLQAKGDLSDQKIRACMDRYGISRNGGMNLFRFAVNPQSFGQTVENLFYISFLIREGGAAIVMDNEGLPTLHDSQASSATEMREKNVQKFQAVFNLDYKTWQGLIDAFDIKEPMIADRTMEEMQQREQVQNLGGRGWYG